MRHLALVLSAFLAAPALAQETSPEEMIARGHYARGAEAYEAGRYADALAEFEEAHASEPLPAFDYNIARCLDHLGRKAEALRAFERYLKVAPEANNAVEVRQRIEILRHELAETSAPSPLSRPIITMTAPPKIPVRHRWLAPGVVGGVALAFTVIGAGLLGSAAASYHSFSTSCAPSCAPALWSALPAREHAGEALLGVAAVVAVVDVALIVRAARRK